MGRGRFFTSLCKCWLYQSGCEAENTSAHMRCVCLCLCLPVSLCLLALVRRGLFSALEEVQEGEGMCLAAAGVALTALQSRALPGPCSVCEDVFAPCRGTAGALSVCMSNDSSAPACGTAWRLTAFLCV